MRKAAVLAKLIPDTATGRARFSLVTEGKASLHFSVQNGLPMAVLEGGDGVVIVDAGDWLFKNVHERLLPHGLNTIRPENHMSVPPSLDLCLILTCCSGIGPYLTARFPSNTVLCALGFLDLVMEPFAALCLIPLTRTTNKDSETHLFMYVGRGISMISSLSSCRRFLDFPS